MKRTKSEIARLRAEMAAAVRDMQAVKGNLALKDAAKRYMWAKTQLRWAEPGAGVAPTRASATPSNRVPAFDAGRLSA